MIKLLKAIFATHKNLEFDIIHEEIEELLETATSIRELQYINKMIGLLISYAITNGEGKKATILSDKLEVKLANLKKGE